MLDSHQLNVFITAAEALNFTQAAQRLNMSQPSVSQHIQALENYFDAKLFIRAGRSLQLTDAGMALIPMARDMVKQSVHIEETMASLKGDVFGHLIVGCSTTPGKYVLPHLLANFHHLHPKVKVTCQVAPQSQTIEKLCDGRVHFALASFARKVCVEAEFRKFMQDPVVLIAPRDHPWAQNGEIGAQELLNANFILREESSGTYQAVRDALVEKGIFIESLKTLLTLGNSEAITLAVQEGLGVGFVSSKVATEIGRDRVAIIKISGISICRDIFIGRHTRLPATKAQISFWDFVCKNEI
jgi:DNA-binding transcriptional LysR family regulator